ncbi:hypothetical protein [Magnetospirillum fulvum]|uniref:Uncharacterized protein n=1 Tax=Magnetospirillum fulvum MGU-K5 TaxID=1316936 RepID=S9SDZ8_MAGFU|nr:hypothetical protein [Magnetospirillum fulvum]EPY02288.1 hypothetical protein K678_06442 [Magnetospirillum fulvum MGU-K5]
MRKLAIKSVEEAEFEAGGLVPALSRALAAVTVLDGTVTTSEYLCLVEAANALADQSDDPAMPAAIALRALAAPEGLDTALRRLREAALGLEEEVRRAGFEVALPLLRVSGDDARDTADRFAAALGLEVDVETLDIPAPVRIRRRGPKPGPFSRLVNRREDERLLAILAVAQAHGHTALARSVGEQLAEGNTNLAALRASIADLSPRIEAQVERLTAQREALGPQRQLAEILSLSITANVRQIEQRLAAMIRRIDFQKETFREDVRTFLDDPANGVDLVVRELMFQDDPLDRDIWDSFANSSHGRSVQLRYGELQRRYESQITLLKEELMQFREELISNRTTFMKTIDPKRSASLAPPPAVGAAVDAEPMHTRPFGRNTTPTVRRESWLGQNVPRIFEFGDLLANVVLVLGALVIGIGAYEVLLEALTLQDLLPQGLTLAAALGVPMLLAGLYKWLASPEKRRVRAARRRRARILSRLDGLMADTVATHDRILDGVVEEFFVAAEQCLAPLVHSTQRTLDVTVLQDRWIDRSTRATRDSLKALSA